MEMHRKINLYRVKFYFTCGFQSKLNPLWECWEILIRKLNWVIKEKYYMHAEQVMAINVQPLIRLTYWVWIFQGKSEKYVSMFSTRSYLKDWVDAHMINSSRKTCPLWKQQTNNEMMLYMNKNYTCYQSVFYSIKPRNKVKFEWDNCKL